MDGSFKTNIDALNSAQYKISNIQYQAYLLQSGINGVKVPSDFPGKNLVNEIIEVASQLCLKINSIKDIVDNALKSLYEIANLTKDGKLLNLKPYDLPDPNVLLKMSEADLAQYNLSADEINAMIKDWVNQGKAPSDWANMNIGDALVKASEKNDIPVIIPLTFLAFRQVYNYMDDDTKCNVDTNPNSNNIFAFDSWQKYDRVEGDVDSGLAKFDDFSDLYDVVDKSVHTIKYRIDPDNKLVGGNDHDANSTTFANMFHEINLTGNNRYDEYDAERNSGTGYIDSNRAVGILTDILNKHNELSEDSVSYLIPSTPVSIEEYPDVTNVFDSTAQSQIPPSAVNTNINVSGTYTVKSGDSLSQIAADNGLTLDELLAANPDIEDPNLINVDQVIKIPGSSDSAQTSQAPQATETNVEPLINSNPEPAEVIVGAEPASHNAQTYTVNSGDTLGQIAADNGVTLDELLAANPNIEDPNIISIGQTINIPGNSNNIETLTDAPQAAEVQVDTTQSTSSPEPAEVIVETGPAKPINSNAHIVESGETLTSIAKDNNTTVDELVRINNIENPDYIVPGQEVKLPTSDVPLNDADRIAKLAEDIWNNGDRGVDRKERLGDDYDAVQDYLWKHYYK